MEYSHKREMALKKEYFWLGVRITLMAIVLLSALIYLFFQ